MKNLRQRSFTWRGITHFAGTPGPLVHGASFQKVPPSGFCLGSASELWGAQVLEDRGRHQ